jgi:hypothetical protein
MCMIEEFRNKTKNPHRFTRTFADWGLSGGQLEIGRPNRSGGIPNSGIERRDVLEICPEAKARQGQEQTRCHRSDMCNKPALVEPLSAKPRQFSAGTPNFHIVSGAAQPFHLHHAHIAWKDMTFDKGDKKYRFFSYWSGKLACRFVRPKNNGKSRR